MKHLSIFFIALAAWCAAGAQAQLFGYKDYNFANQVNVGKGSGQVTNPAAWLEIGPASGGTKGILMPRGDRHAITSPVFGLVIYDTNDGKLYYYNGNSWQPLGAVDPTLFVQNQNSQAQTANFWVNGSGRIDGGLTLGGVLKHAQLVADPTGTNGMVYYLNSTSPGLRTFTNSTWKYVLTGTSADGSGDFIKNQTASQQSAGFNVGNGFASKLGVNTSAFISNEKLHVQGYVLFDSSLTIGMNTPGHEIYLTNGGSIGSGSYLSFVSALGQNVSIGNATYNNVFTVSGSDVNIQPAGGVTLFSIGYTNSQKVTISGTTRIKAPVILDSVINIANIPADPSSGNSNGQTYYNSTSNTLRLYQNGAWTDLITKSANGYITGNIITVDKNSNNSTDSRPGLSKYNSFYPFKSIYAASQAASDGDVLIIQGGTYNDSLITSFTNSMGISVYMYNVNLTGNIKMMGKIFLSNSTLNSVVFFDETPQGDWIVGIDKGTSSLNGCINFRGTAPGVNYVYVKNLAQIQTPATGNYTGSTFTGITTTQFRVSNIGLIQNLSTSSTLVGSSGSSIFSDIGTITSEYTGSGVMFGPVSFVRVGLVQNKGTGPISGGYQSGLQYAENSSFYSNTASYLFYFDNNSASPANSFKDCKFIDTTSSGYAVRFIQNGTRSVYFDHCQFQVKANYLFDCTLFTGTLSTVYLLDCYSNNSSATYINGTTTPGTSIISSYTYNPAFIIQPQAQIF